MSRTLTSAARLGRRHINSITSRSSGPRSDAPPSPGRLNPCSVMRGFMRGSIRDWPFSVKRNLLSHQGLCKFVCDLADRLKPATEHPEPKNFSFEPLVDRIIEGKIYRL